MSTIDFTEIRRFALFDANCRLGPSDVTIASAPATASELTAEMDRVYIRDALVYHASASGYSPGWGNQRLHLDIGNAARLHPCWVMMPHHSAEVESPGLWLARLAENGVRAVRMFPRGHRFSLADWSAGDLLETLARRRVPLFLDFDRTHWAEEVVDYNAVARICHEHPSLPVVLVREGIGSTRYLYALFERHENFHIELSYYQAAGGIADIARRFGAQRMLFGTGLPEYEAGPAIAMLYFAEISFAEKKLIAGDNLRRLLNAAFEG